MAPRAPVTNTTMTFHVRQTFANSSFNSWYFSIFSSSLSFTLSSPGMATSIMTTSHWLHIKFLSIKTISGFLTLIIIIIIIITIEGVFLSLHGFLRLPTGSPRLSSPAFFRYRWNLFADCSNKGSPMMLVTSRTSLRFYRRFTSVFKSWYFSIFSCSLSHTQWSNSLGDLLISVTV